jgi:erythromycin esterase-like protein
MSDPQAYGYATEFGLTESCERNIIAQLIELRQKAFDYIKKDGFVAEDEYFCMQQNAKLVKNAEEYYRSMFRGRPNSWNVRDRHMFETLEDLAEHLGKRLGRDPRIVVWAHNSHIGNAGATDMHKRGEFNIGQLVSEVYKAKAMLVGFSTCRGTVTAASDWDGPTQYQKINEPFPGSYEEVFHHVNLKAFLLDLTENNEAMDNLMTPRLQRAIGVVYRPDTERYSHYFESCLPEQFDFMLHYDDTNAVGALDAVMRVHKSELDETYPSGL